MQGVPPSRRAPLVLVLVLRPSSLVPRTSNSNLREPQIEGRERRTRTRTIRMQGVPPSRRASLVLVLRPSSLELEPQGSPNSTDENDGRRTTDEDESDAVHCIA